VVIIFAFLDLGKNISFSDSLLGLYVFPAVDGIRWGNAKLKKLDHHSFFGNPFYHWLSGHWSVGSD